MVGCGWCSVFGWLVGVVFGGKVCVVGLLVLGKFWR